MVDLFNRGRPGDPYQIVNERLSGTNTDLTGFFFHQGANFYVFSYEKEGLKRHTFIDAGDWRYQDQILSILRENDIDPHHIERIVITHRHPDHCGLAGVLAEESGAKILVHPNFRSFVEGKIPEEERRWLADFGPSQLRQYDIEYLPKPEEGTLRHIGGVYFPKLGEAIDIGDGSELEIFACPESSITHSPDQIIVFYSRQFCTTDHEKAHADLRPTDDILFSGDLWLMTGPLHGQGIIGTLRQLRYRINSVRSLMAAKGVLRRDPREQDSQAKEALKRGFSLIRVKPGHGQEFIGSRIVPQGLLAERDLLAELGYSLDAGTSILGRADLVPQIARLQEHAYTSFVEEVLLWREQGITLDEMAELLVRIYKEQSGGGRLVEKDRRERRERLKETLTRLKDDESAPQELRNLAESTLPDLL